MRVWMGPLWPCVGSNMSRAYCGLRHDLCNEFVLCTSMERHGKAVCCVAVCTRNMRCAGMWCDGHSSSCPWYCAPVVLSMSICAVLTAIPASAASPLHAPGPLCRLLTCWTFMCTSACPC